MRQNANQKKWARIAELLITNSCDRTRLENKDCAFGLCVAASRMGIEYVRADLRKLFEYPLGVYWFPIEDGTSNRRWRKEHDYLRADIATLLSLWSPKELRELLSD